MNAPNMYSSTYILIVTFPIPVYSLKAMERDLISVNHNIVKFQTLFLARQIFIANAEGFIHLRR